VQASYERSTAVVSAGERLDILNQWHPESL
jgi:hypothetical protein